MPFKVFSQNAVFLFLKQIYLHFRKHGNIIAIRKPVYFFKAYLFENTSGNSSFSFTGSLTGKKKEAP